MTTEEPDKAQEPNDKFVANMKFVLGHYEEKMRQHEEAMAALATSPFATKLQEVLAELPAQAEQYVSKFITIGYASFFAIWWLIKDLLTPGQALLTAACMMGSVRAFVAGELLNIFMLNSARCRQQTGRNWHRCKRVASS